MSTLVKYRILLTGFMLGTLMAGLTAFPLNWELGLLTSWSAPHREVFPALVDWMVKVNTGLVETDARFPFIAYGTDWLAFGHMMIAAAYIGPWRQPVRNRFILEWGMFCCIATWPVAFICGPIRGIPWGWTVIDCAFGLVAFPVLWLCWKWSKEMEKDGVFGLGQRELGLPSVPVS